MIDSSDVMIFVGIVLITMAFYLVLPVSALFWFGGFVLVLGLLGAMRKH